MLNIGWSELLMLAIVAIVVVGPKDLPKLMRTVGLYVSKARGMAADFQRQFYEVVAESEAEEVKKNLEAIRASLGRASDLSQPTGKPQMTGPSAPPETDFVAPPQAKAVEPPLPKPLLEEPAKPAAKKKAAVKKAAAKKKPAKKTAAKNTSPKKQSPAHKKAAAVPEDGEAKQ